MSLIFFLLKRALTKAFGNVSDMQKRAPFSHQPQNQNDIIETIWVGMEKIHLEESFGHPDSKQKIDPNTEIWVYQIWNGQKEPTRITMKNDKVITWNKIKETDGPYSSLESQAPPPQQD